MALENLAVWTIPPDWAGLITETLEWLTPVKNSPIGAEQRFRLRTTPRRSFEMTFKPIGPHRTLFDLFIEQVGGSPLWLPIFHDSNKLTIDASMGASDLYIGDTNYTEFADCPAVYLQGKNPFEYEVCEFSSLASDHIHIENGTTKIWKAGTRVFPAIKCTFESQPQASRKASRAYQTNVRFISDQPNPTSAMIVMSKYNNQYVLEIEPNDIADLTYQYQRLMAELDNTTGKRARLDLDGYSVTLQEFTFYAKRRLNQTLLRALFYTLEGRRYPIFIPTFFEDLQVVEDVTDENLVVKRCGFTDFAGPFRGREHILIHLHDGTRLYRKIEGSALIGDGDTEEIVLDSDLGGTVSVREIRKISFLSLGRLDSDRIEIVHQTDSKGLATCTTNFRSIPKVREPIPDPPADGSNLTDAEDGTSGQIEPPPDMIFRADGAAFSFGVGGDWLSVHWENEIQNDGFVFAITNLVLPDHGSFSVESSITWTFEFGIAYPQMRIEVFGGPDTDGIESDDWDGIGSAFKTLSLPRKVITGSGNIVVIQDKANTGGANVHPGNPSSFIVKWWNT